MENDLMPDREDPKSAVQFVKWVVQHVLVPIVAASIPAALPIILAHLK
jgi:hypothetical protein